MNSDSEDFGRLHKLHNVAKGVVILHALTELLG